MTNLKVLEKKVNELEANGVVGLELGDGSRQILVKK